MSCVYLIAYQSPHRPAPHFRVRKTLEQAGELANTYMARDGEPPFLSQAKEWTNSDGQRVWSFDTVTVYECQYF